jgi:hypothetical protein
LIVAYFGGRTVQALFGAPLNKGMPGGGKRE